MKAAQRDVRLLHPDDMKKNEFLVRDINLFLFTPKHLTCYIIKYREPRAGICINLIVC